MSEHDPDALHYPSSPLPKGRSGQLAFMRVKISHGHNGDVGVAVVDRFGKPVHEGSYFYVPPDSIVTMLEARRAVNGGAQ